MVLNLNITMESDKEHSNPSVIYVPQKNNLPRKEQVFFNLKHFT